MSRALTGASYALALAILIAQTSPSLRAQASPPQAAAAISAPPAPTFNLTVEREDVVALIQRLAQQARVSVAFVGDVKGTVTLTLRDASIDQALALITRAAGLESQKVDGTYLIGAAKSDAPAPQASQQAIYRAKYIRADRLVDALKAIFDPEQLRVILGPDEYYSPRLGADSSKSGGGSSGGSDGGLKLDLSGAAGTSSTPSAPSTPPPPPGAVRQIILIGRADIVARAVELSSQMDRPRRQVKFSVKFTNFDYDWLRDFGVRWSWASLGLKEQPKAGATPADQVAALDFGTMTRNPLFINAALTAAENDHTSALKAIPSITVLDGEQGYILIGERDIYPSLTGYTQAQTPIYDKEEVKTGINLALGVRISDVDDMILTLYPQVSGVLGYLTVNGASYPQISTLEQQTTVHVRDGETIVLGGLLSEKTVTQTQGIPGLMKVPYLGRLFSVEHKQVKRTDLVILITAEIVKEP